MLNAITDVIIATYGNIRVYNLASPLPNNEFVCLFCILKLKAPHSGENPVKIYSELWQTMGCRGECTLINGIKRAILDIISRFGSWYPYGCVGSTPITRSSL